MRYTNGVVTVLTVMAMLATSMPATAGIVGTERMVAQETRSQALDRIDLVLSQEAVTSQLLAWGVAPDMVRQRVAAMSDVELQQLATSMESDPAGGVLAVIGIVFVILLILELTGVTSVFSKV